MASSPLWVPALSSIGTASFFRYSNNTTLPASFAALAKALSSAGARGSSKMMSKAITRARASINFLVSTAWRERGHFSGSLGRFNASADALSIDTTTTSGGGSRTPLILNSHWRPTFSSSLRPKGVALISNPSMAAAIPRAADLTRRDIIYFTRLDCTLSPHLARAACNVWLTTEVNRRSV